VCGLLANKELAHITSHDQVTQTWHAAFTAQHVTQ